MTSADGMKKAIKVQKKDTKKWQEVTVPITDARFTGSGPKGCDLQLKNIDDEDDIFDVVEVRR